MNELAHFARRVILRTKQRIAPGITMPLLPDEQLAAIDFAPSEHNAPMHRIAVLPHDDLADIFPTGNTIQ